MYIKYIYIDGKLCVENMTRSNAHCIPSKLAHFLRYFVKDRSEMFSLRNKKCVNLPGWQ